MRNLNCPSLWVQLNFSPNFYFDVCTVNSKGLRVKCKKELSERGEGSGCVDVRLMHGVVCCRRVELLDGLVGVLGVVRRRLQAALSSVHGAQQQGPGGLRLRGLCAQPGAVRDAELSV